MKRGLFSLKCKGDDPLKVSKMVVFNIIPLLSDLLFQGLKPPEKKYNRIWLIVNPVRVAATPSKKIFNILIEAIHRHKCAFLLPQGKGKEWKEARKIVEKYGPAFLKHAQWKPNDIPPGC